MHFLCRLINCCNTGEECKDQADEENSDSNCSHKAHPDLLPYRWEGR